MAPSVLRAVELSIGCFCLDEDMHQDQRISRRLKPPLGVIPARVAGIHRAASASRLGTHGRATVANTRRTEEWAPVTRTGVTSEDRSKVSAIFLRR